MPLRKCHHFEVGFTYIYAIQVYTASFKLYCYSFLLIFWIWTPVFVSSKAVTDLKTVFITPWPFVLSSKYLFYTNCIFKKTIRKNYLNAEFFLVRIFTHLNWKVQMRENTDQKKLLIWTLQWKDSAYLTGSNESMR